mgnify:CR=1 FL=1
MAGQPITEKQFNELEKRISSFKATFGVFNSSTAKRVIDEGFPKSVNITPENIINNSDDILFTNTPDELDTTALNTIGDLVLNNNVKPFRVRTWVLHPDTNLGNIERLARGSFSSSITGHTENQFVERIVMPITEVASTDSQFYVAYGNGDASSGKYFGSGYGTGNNFGNSFFSKMLNVYVDNNIGKIINTIILCRIILSFFNTK